MCEPGTAGPYAAPGAKLLAAADRRPDHAVRRGRRPRFPRLMFRRRRVRMTAAGPCSDGAQRAARHTVVSGLAIQQTIPAPLILQTPRKSRCIIHVALLRSSTRTSRSRTLPDSDRNQSCARCTFGDDSSSGPAMGVDTNGGYCLVNTVPNWDRSSIEAISPGPISTAIRYRVSRSISLRTNRTLLPGGRVQPPYSNAAASSVPLADSSASGAVPLSTTLPQPATADASRTSAVPSTAQITGSGRCRIHPDEKVTGNDPTRPATKGRRKKEELLRSA